MTKNIIAFIMGAVLMFSIFGCASKFKFKNYSSENPELNISLDYSADWSYQEYGGKDYVGVIFLENKKGDTTKGFADFTVRKGSGTENQPEGLEVLLDDLIAKRLKFKDAKVLSKKRGTVLGSKSASVELIYKSLDKIYAVNAQVIPVREKIILFFNKGKLYTLRYQNAEKEFPKFAKAFDHMVASLKIK